MTNCQVFSTKKEKGDKNQETSFVFTLQNSNTDTSLFSFGRITFLKLVYELI